MSILHSSFKMSSALLATLLVIGPAGAQTPEDDLTRIAAFFSEADVLHGPELVDCTLSGGTETTCFAITVSSMPQAYTPGPWCPTKITDGPEAGGIWFLDGETVDVDGDFITRLAEIYGDDDWQLYNPETGEVRYTSTLEGCEAAARPDVDPAYQNYCVQCLPEQLPELTSMTYIIPVIPVPTDRRDPRLRGGAGVAANGVRLDGPAPLENILGAHTIAAFDDCGGHINPHAGYHYHAVTDCIHGAATTLDAPDAEALTAHGGQIGIAMDGYAIFANKLADGSAPIDLDQCNGHQSDGLDYHYHAGAAGSNQNLGCHAAETGCSNVDGETTCDASRPQRPRP